MLDFLRRKSAGVSPAAERPPAPSRVSTGSARFEFADHLTRTAEGFPRLDWDAAYAWVESLDTDERKDEAWVGCVRGWLLHARDHLGDAYRLDEIRGAAILSSLEPGKVETAARFIDRTLENVGEVLQGIARPAAASRVLIVFDDQDAYYRYVAQYYPERGEFASSGGMHIHRGFSHFVTTKGELQSMQRVIAHELVHACVRHLPLPAWLNEGLAVNTEQRVVGRGYAQYSPQEMHGKHRAFWNARTIQELWSGDSFNRAGDAQMLSYDLGRILVEQLAADWPRFSAFVNEAHAQDAGEAAARKHLGVGLGEIAAAMTEQEDTAGWDPDPQHWKQFETRTD